MAIIHPQNGPSKGKIGNQVYVVRNGQQIAREYQPFVSNPSTEAQVDNRAKLKVLSQLGASLGGIIAIPRRGAVSPRNAFTKVNYQYTKASQGVATIKLADMQLTDSAVGLEGFSADRSSGTKLMVELKANMAAQFDRIVYAVVRKMSSGALAPFADIVVTDAGVDGTFPAELPYTADAISVHAYGIKDENAAATAVFSNLKSPTAARVAEVIATRKVNTTDVTISETRGLYMEEGTNFAETSGVVLYAVNGIAIDSAGNNAAAAGSITGGGNFTEGAEVTLVATPNEGYRFVGWRNARNQQGYVSAQTSITVEASQDVTLFAVFAELASTHAVNVLPTNNSARTGDVTGAGSYEEGAEVTLQAGAGNFDGFYSSIDGESNHQLTAAKTYTFTMGAVAQTIYYKWGGDE